MPESSRSTGPCRSSWLRKEGLWTSCSDWRATALPSRRLRRWVSTIGINHRRLGLLWLSEPRRFRRWRLRGRFRLRWWPSRRLESTRRRLPSRVNRVSTLLLVHAVVADLHRRGVLRAEDVRADKLARGGTTHPRWAPELLPHGSRLRLLVPDIGISRHPAVGRRLRRHVAAVRLLVTVVRRRQGFARVEGVLGSRRANLRVVLLHGVVSMLMVVAMSTRVRSVRTSWFPSPFGVRTGVQVRISGEVFVLSKKKIFFFTSNPGLSDVRSCWICLILLGCLS